MTLSGKDTGDQNTPPPWDHSPLGATIHSLSKEDLKSACNPSDHQASSYPGVCNLKQLGLEDYLVALNLQVPIYTPGWKDAN